MLFFKTDAPPILSIRRSEVGLGKQPLVDALDGFFWSLMVNGVPTNLSGSIHVFSSVIKEQQILGPASYHRLCHAIECRIRFHAAMFVRKTVGIKALKKWKSGPNVIHSSDVGIGKNHHRYAALLERFHESNHGRNGCEDFRETFFEFLKAGFQPALNTQLLKELSLTAVTALKSMK